MTEPPTIEHHPKPPIDKVIGAIGAVVVAGCLIWALTWVEENLSYGWFLTAGAAVPIACLLIAFLVDRRGAARKTDRKSGRS